MGKTLGYGEITVANMTEPFTVMLTNEAQQFATDSNRKVTSAQSYYTDIIVIRGSQERTDYTIGNITSGSGITVSKNNKRVTFSVSAGATIGADTGVIEIPITLDGQTVKKQFSWSCGKQGIQGVKGTDGDSFAWNMLSHSSMIGEKIVCQYIEPCNSVITYQYTDEGYHIVTPSSGNANNGIVIRFDNYKDLGIDDGESISFSCDIKGSASSKPCIAIRMGDNLWYGNDVVGKSATFTPTNNWQRFSVSTTTPSNLTKRHIWLAIHGNLQSDLYIKNLKLEKGISATPWSPSQSDIEGKGIAQIVQYYLATSQATGVTSSTSGWSTDITTQKLTADKKYLWNCSQTKYTDGTSEPITTPTIIGAYGDKGETGADGQDGAGFHWNLLKYSGDLSQMSYGKVGGYIDTQEFISDASTPSKNVLKSTITTVGNGIYIQGKYLKKKAIKKGNTYTVSAWCKCSSAKDIGVMNVEFLDKKVNISMPKLSTEWQQYIITGVANKDVTTTSSGSAISFYYGNKLAVGDIFYISSPKVEEGDKASPWCTTYEETLAKSITITPSAQIFKSTDGGNTFAPNQITITPTLQGDITFGKWQYSIDGGVSFADVVSGQSGLSVDTNKNLTIAKTSGLFTDKVTMVTFRAVASDRSFYDTCSIAKLYDVTDIEIGGVNLIKNSNFADGVHRWETIGITCTVETDSTYGHHIKFSSSVVGDGNHRLIASASDNFSHVKDTIYTLSFYAKASANTQVQSNVAGGANPCNYSLTTSWQRYTTTYKASAAGSLTFWAVEASKDIYLANIKLERGNKPTDYTVSPEDVQTAILSTKNSIENVSSKVDTNTKSIQDKVSKTTYETDLKLVKGDLSKANEGLNKWRYEIYPKSLFADKPEDQNKYDIGVFIRNKNLTPSRTLVFDDNKWTLLDYENNYIGYGLTFVRMSAKKTFSTKWAHSSSCSIYVNGKLIISDKGTVRLDSNNTGRDFSCTFIEGWNCIEFVMQETTGNEWFFFKDAISALSECQLMNCYYGTPVARQSHITNQLVENTTNIEGISGSVQKVMSTVGGSGKIDEFVSNYSTWKKKVDGIETRVGETYTTKSDFNGLEIGGRNLLLNSAFKNDRKSWTDWGAPATRELVTSNNKVWAHIVGNKQNYQGFNQWTESGSIKTGDNITFSARIKGGAANQIFTIGIHWMNSSNIIIDQTWHTFTVGTADDVYTWTTTASGANCSKLNLMVGVSDTSTAYNVYFTELKLEKGNKATDWTPAPEDDEINGQNLVSNLPANWEQGSFMDSKTNVGCDYATNKSSMTTRIRVKELVPVSGTITISNAYSNQSKKPIQHWITAFDVNKKWLGSSYVSTAWSDFPRIVDVKDAKYIAVIVRYKDESVITPSDISQICLKIERGTSATPFTLAPEDVNGKIVNVETIANQTAKKFEWIVNGESTSSNLVLTDNALTAIANNINLTGKVTFNSFDQSLKDTINNKMNVSYLKFSSGGNKQGFFKIATLQMKQTHADQNIIFGVNHREHGYTECRIRFSNAGNTDPGMGSFKQTGTPTRAWRIIKTATSTWDLYLAKTDSWDGGRVIKFDNPYGDGVLVTWSGESADLPDGAIIAEQMIADQTTIDGGIITTGYLSADRIAGGSITADKIATDAIKSRNYISSGGTQGSFLNLSDGSFKSPNLSWDSNGNLIAKNANLRGEINATEGSIGGWNIKDSLYSNTREPYDISKYYAKKILNKPSFTNICMNTNVLSAANYGTVGGDHVTIGDSLIATNTAYSFGVNISLGRISLFGSTYYTSDLASELNKSSSLSLSGDKISFWEYDEDGHEISEQNNTYITSNYARFSGDIFIGGDIGTDGGADIGGKLQASSIAAKNGGLIETAGTIYGGGEIQCGGGQMRIIGGDYGILLRNDGSDFYILSTDSGNQYGYWNSKRPFRINLANGIPYFEYGIIIPNENYLLGNGYQMCRGTSWGGVCIGDDSKGLRFYGTSIWASHSISTSDENLKENFTTLDQYEDFYMNLNPIGFNYIGDYDGKKTHFGFGAHKTEDILESEGYDSEKFAVVTHRPLVQEDIEKRFGKDVDVDIETEYGVSYTEFIALNTHMIQKTRKELETVKQEKADLETRLQAIEAKLGL